MFLHGDPTLERGGFSAKSYCAVLDQAMGAIWEPGRLFMQDNTSIHTANLIKDWLKDHAIEVIEWPPHSPDLNPIENLWSMLKRLVYEKHPEIDRLRANDEDIYKLKCALVEAWNALSQEYLDALVELMDDRVEIVYQAHGWWSRY